MLDFVFVIFNLLIYFVYYRSLLNWGINRFAERIIFAYFLLIAQIMITLLLLGAVGQLYAFNAIALNGIITLGIKCISAPRLIYGPSGSLWMACVSSLSNKFLIVLVTFVIAWLLICAYFLPPRCVDDLGYHLPFVYESIQQGKWVLLPTDLMIHFAYPMNMEVLFAWPVLFLGDTRWVDAIQIPMGVWAAGILYLLARHFGLKRHSALFLSGIFLLTPIVIAQMGSNYIDLSSAAFLLFSIYVIIRFLITSRKVYLRLALISIALMMGIKYHLLFLGILLICPIGIILFQRRLWFDLFLGIVLISFLGLGWHIRNYLVFNDFLYPAKLTASYWGVNSAHSGSILSNGVFWLDNLFVHVHNDVSIDGGFGVGYGLMIFIIGLLGAFIFVARKNRWIKGEILLLIVVLLGLLITLPIGRAEFPWIASRMLLLTWPIFILLFGRVFFIYSKELWFKRFIIAFCFLGSVWCMFVSYTTIYAIPHHHWFYKQRYSEFESYRYSSWYVGRLSEVASVTDVVTQSLHRQATVYLVAPSGLFFSAPFYGRFLQSRIVNFDSNFKGNPDFLVYLTISPDPLDYLGKYRKDLQGAIDSLEYREIFDLTYGRVFAYKDVLPLISLPKK